MIIRSRNMEAFRPLHCSGYSSFLPSFLPCTVPNLYPPFLFFFFLGGAAGLRSGSCWLCSMNISRVSKLTTTQVFTLKSMDRNADEEFQVIFFDSTESAPRALCLSQIPLHAPTDLSSPPRLSYACYCRSLFFEDLRRFRYGRVTR